MAGVTVKRVQDEGKTLLLNFIMLRTGGDLVTFFKIIVAVNQLLLQTQSQMQRDCVRQMCSPCVRDDTAGRGLSSRLVARLRFF